MGAEAAGRMESPSQARSLVDTDILIDATKGREAANAFVKTQQRAGLQISIITAMEVVIGCRDAEDPV